MIDPTKVIFASAFNAFKNISNYPGSLQFPTFIPAGQTVTTSTTVQLEEAPVFMPFYAYYIDTLAAEISNPLPQWWSPNVLKSSAAVALFQTSSPTGYNQINGAIFMNFSGTTATITASIFNASASDSTVQSLTVPFTFVDYRLAN